MGEETKELRRLVIKAYHVREVQWGSENEVTENGILTVDKESSGRYKRGKEEYISDISFRIIRPEERDQYTNTIMDIIPISAKVLGDIGDGITHTLTGVYVILTGVDTVGKQTHEFGSSEGNLLEQMKYGKAGTPGENDAMITFDVTLQEGMVRSARESRRRIGPVTSSFRNSGNNSGNFTGTNAQNATSFMM